MNPSSESTPSLSRRDFVKKSIGAASLLSFPTIIPATALGKNGAVAPSNRARIGIIGCGLRAGSAESYHFYDRSDIVAVCDPIGSRREEKRVTWDVDPAHSHTDYRELLARDDIDGVHIVTSDHWHVPLSLEAARAGKHMYTEKPLGLTIEHDLAARQITEKYGRIFQYGTQQRSQPQPRMGLELVLNGHIGDIKEILAWAPAGERGGSDDPVLAVPSDYDLDLWTGPAPLRPFSHDRNLLQGNDNAIFHVRDYALGFIAGWGAHPLDLLQWWADMEGRGIPVDYRGLGFVPSEGLRDTVTHWDVTAHYADGVRLRFMDFTTAQPYVKHAGGSYNGTLFIGTKGWICVARSAFFASSPELRQQARDPGPIQLKRSSNHFENFVDAILDDEEPIAPLDSAIRSDLISQLSEIAIRTGEQVDWDPVTEQVLGSDEAKAMVHRPLRAPYDLLG